MSKQKLLFLSLLIGFLAAPLTAQAALNLSASLSGRILLQVQDKGQAWYVYPIDQKRYFLGSPDDAFAIMRNSGWAFPIRILIIWHFKCRPGSWAAF